MFPAMERAVRPKHPPPGVFACSSTWKWRSQSLHTIGHCAGRISTLSSLFLECILVEVEVLSCLLAPHACFFTYDWSSAPIGHGRPPPVALHLWTGQAFTPPTAGAHPCACAQTTTTHQDKVRGVGKPRGQLAHGIHTLTCSSSPATSVSRICRPLLRP